MSRNLIDRDALIASIPKTNVDIFENCRNCSTLCDWQVRELIEQAELVDAVEVIHGEWVEKWRFKPNGIPYHKVGDMECSVCHSDMLGRYYSRYCPHCGARMKGEQE